MSQSTNWEKASILDRMEKTKSTDAGLQVFLGEDVSRSDVDAIARNIVDIAKGSGAASIGPISRIAKSFAVHGDVSILRRVAQDSRVRAILPTAVDDIYPTPIRKY